MRNRIAVLYNRPHPSRYDHTHEVKALLGVLPCVTAVHRTLIGLGYSVTIVPLSPPAEQARNVLYSLDTGLIFNLFEGFLGDSRSEASVLEIPTPLTDGTWDMYWEAVAQEKRGQGIGTALMKAAEEQIRKAGGILVLIETSSTPAYEKTRRFHTGIGYEIIARIPDFYSPGDDKLISRKKLK